MQCIAIVGCGGSGKSVLARALAERTRLPVTHLDCVHYDADWNPLPKDQFAAIQHDLVQQPGWIIDGNYASTLPIRLAVADTVIFLDLSAATCLWGVLKRRMRYRGGQHQDAGVFDRINWSFVKYILGYRRGMRPRVMDLIEEYAPKANVVILRSRRQTRRYLATEAATD
ncbi:topology modulation protein [Peterkaempfera sp. SMS 1(5)a]|uniref:topology modulation protein n=1 Tax=Peterkaempfera podocarpi TaxID=3232308 RepID=UPI00366F8BCF